MIYYWPDPFAVLVWFHMESSELDESSLWVRAGSKLPPVRLELHHPRSFAIIPYNSSGKWKVEVSRLAPATHQITIQNFETSLENLTFADEIVTRFSFNWRFSECDLVLERPSS